MLEFWRLTAGSPHPLDDAPDALWTHNPVNSVYGVRGWVGVVVRAHKGSGIREKELNGCCSSAPPPI